MTKEEYKTFIDERLQSIDGIRSKNMFGGVGYFMNDLMFGGIMHGAFRLKADDLNRPDYEAKGMGPWIVPGKNMKMPYYEVPQEIIENDVQLKDWVLKAVEAAERTKKVKKKK